MAEMDAFAARGLRGSAVIGPIERELRSGSVQLANWQCSEAALRMCSGAASQLGFPTMLDAYNKNAWPDVLTEAICAAAAQGL